jgi:hypothetical protein
MPRIFLTLALAMAFGHAAGGADKTTTKRTESMKIRLKLADKVLTATLIDSKTVQDFVSLLPLTLTINDLFRSSATCRERSRKRGNERIHTKSGTSPTGPLDLTLRSSTAMTARRFPIPASLSSARSIPAWKLLVCPPR